MKKSEEKILQLRREENKDGKSRMGSAKQAKRSKGLRTSSEKRVKATAGQETKKQKKKPHGNVFFKASSTILSPSNRFGL